jgi:hypothetical protein
MRRGVDDVDVDVVAPVCVCLCLCLCLYLDGGVQEGGWRDAGCGFGRGWRRRGWWRLSFAVRTSRDYEAHVQRKESIPEQRYCRKITEYG